MTLPIKLKLDEVFFREETRNGYVVSSEMKVLWAVLLDLLKEFMDVCDRNGIRYYACGGTLLGAIRHKGIIPWDDDIDVMMFREDYEKLSSIASSEFKHPYFFQTEYTDRGSLRGHAQLRNSETTGILVGEKGLFSFNQGMFLDIFPLDNLPDGCEQRKSYFSKIDQCRAKMAVIREYDYPYILNFQKNPLKLGKKIVKNVMYRTVLKNRSLLDVAYGQFEAALVSYNKEKTSDVVLSPLNLERYSWNRADFEGEPVRVAFEQFEIPVPSGYLNMLNKTYGEWRKYVVGGTVHGSVIFDGFRSYREYLPRLRQELFDGKTVLFRNLDG